MELHIRHLSGSKAGKEEVFDSDSIRLGREPSNDVTFDPYKDIVVSGRHAEITHDGNKWMVRDLGSSNGTYVGEERISIKALRSGDSVQLGRGGPRIEVRFASDEIPMTIVEGFDDPPRTVIMDRDLPSPAEMTQLMMPDEKPTLRQGTIARLFTVSTPKGPRLRTMPLAIVAAALILAIGGVTAVRMNRPAAVPTKPQASADVAKLRKDLEARESQLKALEQKVNAALSDTAGVVSQDLDRQVRSEQVLIETLRSQLQQKNDQLAAKTRELNLGAAKQIAPPVQTTSGTTATTSAATETTAPAEMPPEAFIRTKSLKKRINLVSDASGDGVPASLGGDFAGAVGAVLATTGNFTIDSSAPVTIHAGVAHYASVRQTPTPQQASVMAKMRNMVRGRDGAQQPPTASQNIDMTAALSIADAHGNSIGAAKPTYAVSGVPAAGDAPQLSLADALHADRPDADVVRYVIANTADEAIRSLAAIEPEITVRSTKGDIIGLDAGRNVGIAVDDIFEVLDGSRVIARARIESVQDTIAIAYVTPPNVNVAGRQVRYAGVKKTATVSAPAEHTGSIKQPVDAYEGPGTSFKSAANLAAGTKVRLIYSVGSWARVDKGGQSMWVPSSSIEAQ